MEAVPGNWAKVSLLQHRIQCEYVTYRNIRPRWLKSTSIARLRAKLDAHHDINRTAEADSLP